MKILKNSPESLRLTAAVRKALATVKAEAEIRRAPVLVQLLAVAKGLIDPADVRIGGTLNAEESQRFFTSMADDGSLAQVATERMARLTKNLDAMDISPQQLRRVAQGDLPADGDLTATTNPGNKLNALNAQLFARVTLDTLRDNAASPNFVAEIRNRLVTVWQNDLCDLAMNGTAATGASFLALNEGWLTLAAARSGVRDVVVSPGGMNYAEASVGVVASNNALTYTARQGGTAGNAIRVIRLDPGAASQALAVAVSGTTITISLATSSGSAITTTAALEKAAVEASANASALVSVAHTGASTGAGVVGVANKLLEGGGLVGWIDAFAAIRAAAPALIRDRCAIVCSTNNADAYAVEIGKHVTGAAVIANTGGQGFLGQKVLPWPTMPDTKILYTPPENLVVGIHDRIERTATYDGVRRSLDLVTDAAFDFEFRVDSLVTLADVQ